MLRGNQCSGFGGAKSDPGFRDDESSYIFPSWRDAIAEAQQQIGWAYERRRMVFQRAREAGLTHRDIGEAAGLSAAGVHKIIGRQKASLDDPADSPSRGRA